MRYTVSRPVPIGFNSTSREAGGVEKHPQDSLWPLPVAPWQRSNQNPANSALSPSAVFRGRSTAHPAPCRRLADALDARRIGQVRYISAGHNADPAVLPN